MFTDADKQNLIRELNKELETNTFYNNPLISNRTKNNFNDIKDNDMNRASFESMPKFEGSIAFRDTVFNSATSLEDIDFEEKNITVPFNTDGLFRPLINKNTINLNNKVYNYSASYTTPVHGIAFKGGTHNDVKNPFSRHHNVTDNVYANSLAWSEPIKEIDDCDWKNKKEIYQMADVLKDTKESQVISFSTIPDELSLVASTPKWKSILYKEINLKEILLKDIDIKGIFKNAFGKNKK